MASKRKLAIAAVVALAALGFSAPALATIAYPPEGGTWSYGTGGGIVWSDYYHGWRCHGSSVQGVYFYRSPNTAPGYWSIADAPERPGTVDQSWYRTC